MLHGTDPPYNLFHIPFCLYRSLAMSTIKPAFDTVRLGSEPNAITVQLLKFPRTDGQLLDKVQAFGYFEEVIRQHRTQLSSATVQQAYATHIPISSSAAASEEANRIACQIYDSFFVVGNLQCLGFFKSNSLPVAVAPNAWDRDSDIRFVQFEATVAPAPFSSVLAAIPPAVIPFFLKLPQSAPPAKPAAKKATISDSDARDTADAASAAATAAEAARVSEAAIVSAFAKGGTIGDLDLDDPTVAAALASIITKATAAPVATTPSTPSRRLFANSSPSPDVTSPSIRPYLTGADTSANPTFCGQLDFLDNQALFDSVFPPLDRHPIGSLQPVISHSVLENTAELAIQAFLAACRLLIFQTVIRLDYIGRHDFASADHLQMTVKRIRNLTLEFSMRGKMIHGNPDMLFSQYLALTPLLPASHVNIWGINLFTQFWSALGEDLTRRIARLPRYLAIYESEFDLTTMSTKERQMSALRELRSLAVDSFNSMQDDRQSMRSMLQEFSPQHQAASHLVDSSIHASAAEVTMQRYSDPPAPSAPAAAPAPAAQTLHQVPSPPPYGPSPGVPVGEFPPDFRGCLGCGGPEHVFRSCPMKHDRDTIARFHRNFNAKFNRQGRDPDTRRNDARPPDGTYGPSSRNQNSYQPRDDARPPNGPYGPSPRNLNSFQQVPQFQPPTGNPPAFGSSAPVGAGRGAARNTPAWMSQQHLAQPRLDIAGSTPSADASPTAQPAKRIRNFPLFVRSCNQAADTPQSLRPMPIRVDNGLPHIRLCLGLSDDTALSVLFDSGAALSSGYLPYHLWIMRENPDLVASFEKFDDSNPFEPIKLGGAIRHPDDYKESLHGQLTAIIRYKTPYVDHDGNPIRISFGLGNDMTVNTILGMPFIKDLGMVPNFRAGTVTCEDSSATFDISYQATSFGFLPDDADAAVFAALPVAHMYPSKLSMAAIVAPPDAADEPCVDAVDDTTKGFLQRTLL
jgi:hypothetical protein